MSPAEKTMFSVLCRWCKKLFFTTVDSWVCTNPDCKYDNRSAASVP